MVRAPWRRRAARSAVSGSFARCSRSSTSAHLRANTGWFSTWWRLTPCAHVGPAGRPFAVRDDRARLVHDAEALAPRREAKVAVLEIRRREAFVEAADALEQRAANEHRRAGAIVDVARVLVRGIVGALSAPVVPPARVTPDDAAGFLQRAVGVDELRAHHADGRIALRRLHERVEPPGVHFRVVVQEHEVRRAGQLRRTVARAQEPEVRSVPDHGEPGNARERCSRAPSAMRRRRARRRRRRSAADAPRAHGCTASSARRCRRPAR